MRRSDARDGSSCRQCDDAVELDKWLPNNVIHNDGGSSGYSHVGDERIAANHNTNEISYKVSNPDGTETRMSKQKKKQLKYKLQLAKREAQKEKRQIEHNQRIQKSKEAKRERMKLKRLERKNKQEQEEHLELSEELSCQEKSFHDEAKEGNDSSQNAEDYIIDSKEFVLTSSIEIDEELAALNGERGGIPPAMLAPAATSVALHMKVVKCTKGQDQDAKTIFDSELTREWADELQRSMIPAEELRAKEDMRPMAYKIVPELWRRLCPASLTECKDEMNRTAATKATDEFTPHNENQYSLGLLRNPSPSNDEVAYTVFRHLHRYSNLHISCGEVFGCDFLLYDGKREDRHAFAGLRIYTCDKKNNEFIYPIPSAYDMAGFVRAMTTARKLALVATVVKDEGDGNVHRVLIVDLALEKVLSVPTHIKKGSTEKRRSEKDASIGLAKRKT